MKYKPILIVAGDPNSIFLEIFFKSVKYKKFKSPIVLICSKNLLLKNMKKFKFKKKIKLLNLEKINDYKLNNNFLNLVDVNLTTSKNLFNINKYIETSFSVSLNLIKKGFSYKLINGPISKKNFLRKKYLGITEFLTTKYMIKKYAMLIYNKKLSICPITTHLPIKQVTKNINKKAIIDKVNLINHFYKTQLKRIPKIAILGLNPHCETISKFDEDEKIIKPAINYLKKKKIKTYGPYSADTIFLRENRKKYDVIVGMYHDQVLTPIKTLFEYDAINITLGLPFTRITPDHGPNIKMVGKNKSNPISLIRSINFLDLIWLKQKKV